jgi:MFS family permease
MQKNTSALLGFSGLTLLNFLGCLDLTIVNTALPAIQQTFGVSDDILQWVMNVLLISLALFMVLLGKCADHYGRARVIYIGMALFAISSLGAGLSSVFGYLIFFRFLQGLAIAILYTAPVAILPILFPNQAAKYTGIMFGISGLAIAAGPALGGILTDLFSWHAIFLINLPITLISFLLCFKHLPQEEIKVKEKLQPLKTIALGIFMPFIDKKNFGHRFFHIGLLANFFLAFFYAVNFFFVPLHLNAVGYTSTLIIGLILLPANIMVAVLSPFSEWFCKKLSPRVVLSIGYSLFLISALSQHFLAGQHELIFILPPLILFGIGWACILTPSFITALSSVPESKGASAMGSIGTWHNIGGACGLALGASLGYQNGMLLITASSLVALLAIILGLKGKQPKQHTHLENLPNFPV